MIAMIGDLRGIRSPSGLSVEAESRDAGCSSKEYTRWLE
jgi:hypothetical protein